MIQIFNISFLALYSVIYLYYIITSAQKDYKKILRGIEIKHKPLFVQRTLVWTAYGLTIAQHGTPEKFSLFKAVLDTPMAYWYTFFRLNPEILLKVGTCMVLPTSLWWVLFDGLLNKLRGLGWFYLGGKDPEEDSLGENIFGRSKFLYYISIILKVTLPIILISYLIWN